MCCYRILKTSFAYRSCNDTSHRFATLFFEFDVILSPPFSIATTTLQVFSDHLSSSQFFQLVSTAAAANSSQSCSISSPLTSTLFTSSLLFSTLPNDSRLVFTLPTQHVPVLLCTTNLAQSTSQYYFVLQRLHLARPSTKHACTGQQRNNRRPPEIANLSQFRAIDAHDPTEGLPQATLQFRAMDAHDPTEGLSATSRGTAEITILLQFRAINAHDPTEGLQIRKHLPDQGRPQKHRV